MSEIVDLDSRETGEYLLLDDGRKVEGDLSLDTLEWICVTNDKGVYHYNPHHVIFYKMNQEDVVIIGKSHVIYGYISTFLMFFASPLAAMLINSIIGWIFYVGSAGFGIIYCIYNKDKPFFIQFCWYMIWNIAAIVTRIM